MTAITIFTLYIYGMMAGAAATVAAIWKAAVPRGYRIRRKR